MKGVFVTSFRQDLNTKLFEYSKACAVIQQAKIFLNTFWNPFHRLILFVGL